MSKEKKQRKPGTGQHGKQGRKKSERRLKPVTILIYEDQHPISNKEIREAIDLKNNQGFIPNPSDTLYMNDDEDISFPKI